MDENKTSVATTYNLLSVWIHWLTIPAILVMYLTALHGNNVTNYHLVLGPVIGTFLIFRTVYRANAGLLRLDAEDHEARSHAACVWILLIIIIGLVLSGTFSVWANQLPLQIFGLQIELPWLLSEQLSKIITTIHRASSYLLIPALVLHIVVSKASERIFTADDQPGNSS